MDGCVDSQFKETIIRLNQDKQLVAESKPARAIRRHNHGLVNKHGLVGAYFAKRERKLWLESKGKPYIKLSSISV